LTDSWTKCHPTWLTLKGYLGYLSTPQANLLIIIRSVEAKIADFLNDQFLTVANLI